jgi:hypothetical protein
MAPEATHEAHVVEDGHTGWRMKNKLLDWCAAVTAEWGMLFTIYLSFSSRHTAYRLPLTGGAKRKRRTRVHDARKQASKHARCLLVTSHCMQQLVHVGATLALTSNCP